MLWNKYEVKKKTCTAHICCWKWLNYVALVISYIKTYASLHRLQKVAVVHTQTPEHVALYTHKFLLGNFFLWTPRDAATEGHQPGTEVVTIKESKPSLLQEVSVNSYQQLTPHSHHQPHDCTRMDRVKNRLNAHALTAACKDAWNIVCISQTFIRRGETQPRFTSTACGQHSTEPPG